MKIVLATLAQYLLEGELGQIFVNLRKCHNSNLYTEKLSDAFVWISLTVQANVCMHMLSSFLMFECLSYDIISPMNL